MFNQLQIGQQIAIVAGVIYCVTLHELAHAWVATWCGDPTPGRHGRLTWNPLVQLHPIYSVALPIFSAFFTGFPFGWAYCPIDPSRFKRPLRDRALVAIAGPIINLVAAVVCIAVLWLPWVATPDKMNFAIFYFIALFNVLLAAFNMLPLPPLDGYDVLRPILPLRVRNSTDSFRRMGFLPIFLVLMVGPHLLGVVWPDIRDVFESLLPRYS